MGRHSTLAAMAVLLYAVAGVQATTFFSSYPYSPLPGLGSVLLGGKLIAAKAVGLGGAKLIKASLLKPVVGKVIAKPLFGAAVKGLPFAKGVPFGPKFLLPFKKVFPIVKKPIIVPTVHQTTIVKAQPEWPSAAWPSSSEWAWPSASAWPAEWPSSYSSLGAGVYGGSYGSVYGGSYGSFPAVSVGSAVPSTLSLGIPAATYSAGPVAAPAATYSVAPVAAPVPTYSAVSAGVPQPEFSSVSLSAAKVAAAPKFAPVTYGVKRVAPVYGSAFGQGAPVKSYGSAFGQGAPVQSYGSAFGQGAPVQSYGSAFGQGAPVQSYGSSYALAKPQPVTYSVVKPAPVASPAPKFVAAGFAAYSSGGHGAGWAFPAASSSEWPLVYPKAKPSFFVGPTVKL